MTMRVSVRRLLLACMTSAVLVTAAFAQPTTLTGTIVGADGKPKAFAQIQLQGQARYAAVSDVSGKFVIQNFTPGTYVANIRQNNNVQQLTVDINGATTTVAVKW
jgi:hypothetical protein